MVNPRRPTAQPHGEIRRIFDDIFMVRGRFRMTGGPPIAFSRNMVIIRHDTSLTLVNSMQLSEAGPGWLKTAKPDPRDLRNILDLPFEHVLPAHGDSVIGGARAHWRKAIEALPLR